METKMRENPMISVIMGIYNCAETLETAVECIINQTYTNWELIMCDDCSNDDTLRVAMKLAEKDKRIIILKNEENITLAPSLNKCLMVARGQYIARMDGDDLCAKDRFEKELSFLERFPEYAMVSCQMELFDKAGTYRIISHKQEPKGKDLVYRSQFCHAGCMIRTSVMRELGGYRVNKSCQRVEDYDLWVRMYAKGYKGYNLQEPLYSMRDDRNALNRRNFRNRLNECKVKWQVCKELRLPITNYPQIVVPIIKWLLPRAIYKFAHRMKRIS